MSETLTGQYEGFWTYAQNLGGSALKDVGFFRIWFKEDGMGKLFEIYNGSLVEAYVHSAIIGSGEVKTVSFKKKYVNPRGDLTDREISYEGAIKNPLDEVIIGTWRIPSTGGETTGDFYMNRLGYYGELGELFWEVARNNLIARLTNREREFPFTL